MLSQKCNKGLSLCLQGISLHINQAGPVSDKKERQIILPNMYYRTTHNPKILIRQVKGCGRVLKKDCVSAHRGNENTSKRSFCISVRLVLLVTKKEDLVGK